MSHFEQPAEDTKAILTRLKEGKISFEDAKKLLIPGAGYPETVLDHINNIDGVNTQELAERIIETGGSTFLIDHWNELPGIDTNVLTDKIIQRGDLPFDRESLETIAGPIGVGALLNLAAEKGVSSDYFKVAISEAEDGSLGIRIAQKLLDDDYTATLKVYLNKFTPDTQVFITEALAKQTT